MEKKQPKSLRIIFMGTPDFSLPTLKSLIHSDHDIVAVYSQPPRPSGRGQKTTKSPIHSLAKDHNIPIFTPKSLHNTEEQNQFSKFNADVAIVVAYGLILPKEILNAPRYGCLNIHASLLPRWRGAAPIQRAILAGDQQSGITLMQMDIGLDTGAMLAKESVQITSQTTAQTLHNVLSELGATMILPLLNSLDNLTPEIQDETNVTYAEKLSKSEAQLDFTKTAKELERQIRAFTPWPGSFFKWQNKTIKVLKAHCVNQEQWIKLGNLHVNKDSIVIDCQKGALFLEEIQIQGKKPMNIKSFINGYAPKQGDIIQGNHK